jgi:hypothetical protein
MATWEFDRGKFSSMIFESRRLRSYNSLIHKGPQIEIRPLIGFNTDFLHRCSAFSIRVVITFRAMKILDWLTPNEAMMWKISIGKL